MDEETRTGGPAGQVALDETQRVRQHGYSLGDLAGCTVVTLDDAAYAAVLALLGQVEGDGGVELAADGTPALVPPTPAWGAAQAAQAAADTAFRAAIAAHPDPLVQELARRLGAA